MKRCLYCGEHKKSDKGRCHTQCSSFISQITQYMKVKLQNIDDIQERFKAAKSIILSRRMFQSLPYRKNFSYQDYLDIINDKHKEDMNKRGFNRL